MQFATRQVFTHGGLAVILLVVSPPITAMAARRLQPRVAGRAAGLAMAVHDTIVHVVQRGDTLHDLAGRYRAEAGWYNLTDCLQAIRHANGLEHRDLLRPGDRLRVPVAAALPPPVVTRPARGGADLRGLYLPAIACSRSSVFERIDRFVEVGGNGVVFDAKDIDGGLTFRSGQDLAAYGEGCFGPTIPDLPAFVDRLHRRDLWVVARLALFLDGQLGGRRPDLALADSLGAPWSERGCTWMDPALAEVRGYNLGLALELAEAGVDEIQVDYVRFPTNGWRGDWQGDLAATAARRRGIITSFVAALHDSLQSRGCRLSAAIFGIAAWGRTEDLALTGQHVPSLAAHLDVICPMIYPSHFEPGFEGYAHPADHPAEVITAGVARCRDLAGETLLVRPWLQAFPWRVSDYDGGYVQLQIQAATSAGASGWSLWNPAGRYEVASTALLP
ncbi:MAG: putative glycoside hydrolase [Candidatus Krumholzibacteriia bacterium]